MKERERGREGGMRGIERERKSEGGSLRGEGKETGNKYRNHFSIIVM